MFSGDVAAKSDFFKFDFKIQRLAYLLLLLRKTIAVCRLYNCIGP